MTTHGEQHRKTPPAAGLTICRATSNDAPSCERIMRDLPGWFGIEEAIQRYAADVAEMESYVAEDEMGAAGFVALKTHNSVSVEIQVIAVRSDAHRKGVGRAFVQHAEAILRERGVELLHVKTLGPSRYVATQRFYEVMGFRPLEENTCSGAT